MSTKGQEWPRKPHRIAAVFRESTMDRLLQAAGYHDVEEARHDERVFAAQRELASILGIPREEAVELLCNDDSTANAIYDGLRIKHGVTVRE